MALKQHLETRSRVFIYPMLRLPHYFSSFIHNVYIKHEDFKELVDPHIYVLMKFHPDYSNNINFEDLERIIQDHPDYFTQYDINKGSYVCFVFTVPEIHIDDYLMFLEGKYSKFSEDYQKYLTDNNPDSYFYKVFHKDKMLRRIVEEAIGEKLEDWQEVVSKPDIEEETFTKDKL